MTTKRRLAAIMFTDVVGYTAIMSRDEPLALSMLQSHEKHLESLVAKYNGKVVQYYGDGSLSLFDSAHDAVSCARELQLALTDEDYVPLRIGLHIGEVVEKDGRIYGDGVNVTSRIESSGHAGTVLLSEHFYEKVKNDTGLHFRDLGKFRFKNVDAPMKVYGLAVEGIAAIDVHKLSNRSSRRPLAGMRWMLYVLAVVLVTVAGTQFFLKGNDAASNDDLGSDPLEAIAIFPFEIKASTNLEYLSEGFVDVFSTKIDGVSGYSAVDPNQVIGAYRKEEAKPTVPADYAALAREVGAGQFMLGNLTEFGEDIRIKVAQYDLSGTVLSSAEVVIHEVDSLLEAVDDLTRQTIAVRYERTGQESTAAQVLFSKDLKAVKYFLSGEEHRRNGLNKEASQFYTRAVNIDSTMALAWLRLWQVCSWNFYCPTPTNIFIDNAVKYRSNLPPKLREYIEASFLLPGRTGQERIEAFQDLINKYGENLDFLVGLGEAIFHAPPGTAVSPLDALPYFLQSFEIDPGNSEVLNHVGQLLAYSGDAATVLAIRDRLPYTSENWPVFSALYLILTDTSWTDAELQAIMQHPNFSMENIFLRVRSENTLLTTRNMYDRLVELNGKVFNTPNVPVHSLIQFWSGKESQVFGAFNSFDQNMPGVYSMPMYNVEADRNLGEGYLEDNYKMFESGREGYGLYPDDFPMAMLALAERDFASYHEHYKVLARLSGTDQKYARSLALCRALELRKQGDFMRSNMVLDSAVQFYDTEIDRLYNYFISTIIENTIAENYASMNDFPSALDVLEKQFIVINTGEDRIVAHSLLRRGEICEQLGLHKEALQYLDKFLALMVDSDPVYQPWIDRALESRDNVFSNLN